MPDSTARFLDYWRAGYRRIIPITPPGCDVSPRSSLSLPGRKKDIGKAPGVRGGDGLWRSFNWMAHETSEADLGRWGAMGAGVGIKMGGGLVAVDIDSLDKATVLTILRLTREMLGKAPVRVGRFPKCLLLFACAEDVPYQRVDFTLPSEGKVERVELLGEGRQFVTHGIHPVTGKSYEWLDATGKPLDIPPPRDQLPAVTSAQLDAFFARLAEILPEARLPAKSSTDTTPRDQESLRGDPALVAEAVRATPNTSALFPSYDSYVEYGAAIKGALGGEGEELFVEWAMKWEGGEEHTPERVAGDFRRIKSPYRLGADYLYSKAAAHGGFNPAKAYFDVIEDEPPNAGRFRFISHDEAAARSSEQSARPLVKGLLDQGAMSVVYGASNVGKSFLVLDMAHHIATGKPWGGMRTVRHAVAYVAAEGGGGIMKRFEALLRKHGSAGERLRLLASSVDLLRPHADLKDLIAALKEIAELGLVVIDTTSRALAGGDENSSVDMGAFIKNCDALRQATGAHLMLIHHSGKDESRGARGWSGIRAAIDTEIEVREGLIEVKKQRDLDKNWSSGFVLEGMHLRNDSDGDAVTSATVRLVSEEEGRRETDKLSDKQRLILQFVEDDKALNTPRQIADRMAEAGVSGDLSAAAISTDLGRMVTKKALRVAGKDGTANRYARVKTYGESIRVEEGPFFGDLNKRHLNTSTKDAKKPVETIFH